MMRAEYIEVSLDGTVGEGYGTGRGPNGEQGYLYIVGIMLPQCAHKRNRQVLVLKHDATHHLYYHLYYQEAQRMPYTI